MKRTWRVVLSGLTLAAAAAFAVPGTASAQVDCHQCSSWNYCQDLCQWESFGEYYFSECRYWTSECQEYPWLTSPGAEQNSAAPACLAPGAATEAPLALVAG